MKVYKYRALEHFERDFKTLLKNQIYASPFIDLNDPFEGLYNEQITELTLALEKTFNQDFTKVRTALSDLKDLKNKVGIYSLSPIFSNELMWAHYASSHKGFCLEYETIKLKDKYLAPKLVTELEVDYQQENPKVTYPDTKKIKIIYQKLFATKSLKWSEEEEVRLIFETSGVKNYHPSALTGIYFGMKFPAENKKRLIDSLTNRNICFYDIENNSYDLSRKLMHENKEPTQKKLDANIYEIIRTYHSPAVDNFDVLYKGKEINKEQLDSFFESFREDHTIKDCNIFLYDHKKIIPLIYKHHSELSPNEYIELADHFIAACDFDTKVLDWYPYQDSTYKEYGGMNWKKQKL